MAGLPVAGPSGRSRFIRLAFAGFTSCLVSRAPDSDRHLMYNGHGGPDMLLFAGQLPNQDANDMLAHWTRSFDRPLGVAAQ